MIVFRGGPLGGDLALAAEPFAIPGVYTEGAGQFGMLAVDIDATADLKQIADLLKRGVNDGWWEYDEGRITDQWVAATSS